MTDLPYVSPIHLGDTADLSPLGQTKLKAVTLREKIHWKQNHLHVIYFSTHCNIHVFSHAHATGVAVQR